MLRRMCTWMQLLKLIVRLLHCLPTSGPLITTSSQHSSCQFTDFSYYYLYTGQFGSNWTPLKLSNLVILLFNITCYSLLYTNTSGSFDSVIHSLCNSHLWGNTFPTCVPFPSTPTPTCRGISGTAFSLLVLNSSKFNMSSCFVCLIFYVLLPEIFHRYEIQGTRWPTVWSNSSQSISLE
jgi:hypothetical protein